MAVLSSRVRSTWRTQCVRENSAVRPRLLLWALLAAAAVVGAVAVIAVFDSGDTGRTSTVVTAEVSSLRSGRVLLVEVDLPSTGVPPFRDPGAARVFFVRDAG